MRERLMAHNRCVCDDCCAIFRCGGSRPARGAVGGGATHDSGMAGLLGRGIARQPSGTHRRGDSCADSVVDMWIMGLGHGGRRGERLSSGSVRSAAHCRAGMAGHHGRAGRRRRSCVCRVWFDEERLCVGYVGVCRVRVCQRRCHGGRVVLPGQRRRRISVCWWGGECDRLVVRQCGGAACKENTADMTCCEEWRSTHVSRRNHAP